MFIPTFQAKVEQNRLKMEKPQEFGIWCSQFEGKNVEVVVKQRKKPRTTGKPDEKGNQNGYYWSVILPISAKELGYTVEEMHEVFTNEFAPYTYRDFGNKKITLKTRTSQMNTIQFTEYVESIRMKMAEFGIVIPDPIKYEN